MAIWMPCPFERDPWHDSTTVARQWQNLHAGDAEPLPTHEGLLDGWALYHRGEFQRAAEAGLALAESGLDAGTTLANKATAIYANYVERSEKARLALFLAVAERAERQTRANPDNASAHYWLAYSLGRYSQGISVAKALAQGLGNRIKQALERTIVLQPRHADAHTALGTFHAEVIDKVGVLIAGMTYGANEDASLRMFQQALQLHPRSATGIIEYAQALVMLQGESAHPECGRLYERAIASEVLDVRERLDVELARQEMAQG